MPKLIRLYVTHVLIGFALSALFTGLLLWLNVANLWSLVSRSDMGLVAVGMLWFTNGIVFAGVQFGWAVMNMAETPKGPRRGTPITPTLQAVPAVASKPKIKR